MTIRKTVLNNGSKSILIHVYLSNDGENLEFVNNNLVDPTDYDPNSDLLVEPNMKLTLTQVWHSFSWFDGLLSFDFTEPVPSWVLARDANNHVDFRHFGGMADRYQGIQDKDSTDRKGVILLSTSGFAEPGAVGTMILELKKTRA